MPKHKSEDYKLSAVQHYLEKKDNQIVIYSNALQEVL